VLGWVNVLAFGAGEQGSLQYKAVKPDAGSGAHSQPDHAGPN